MARIELFGTDELSDSKDGITATRLFKSDWAERYLVAPKIGEPFDASDPILCQCRCIGRTFEGIGSVTQTGEYTQCKITARYSTLALDTSSLPIESFEFAAEALECALGRTWQETGSMCKTPQAVFIPRLEPVFEFVTESFNRVTIANMVGKLNNSEWMGYPAETLIFEGCSIRQEYSVEGESRWRVILKFLHRPISHNVVWRAPEMEYNDDNKLVPVAGIDGTGGWDRLIPDLYETADFNELIPG
jgi:hypothetical protein